MMMTGISLHQFAAFTLGILQVAETAIWIFRRPHLASATLAVFSGIFCFLIFRAFLRIIRGESPLIHIVKTEAGVRTAHFAAFQLSVQQSGMILRIFTMVIRRTAGIRRRCIASDLEAAIVVRRLRLFRFGRFVRCHRFGWLFRLLTIAGIHWFVAFRRCRRSQIHLNIGNDRLVAGSLLSGLDPSEDSIPGARHQERRN